MISILSNITMFVTITSEGIEAMLPQMSHDEILESVPEDIRRLVRNKMQNGFKPLPDWFLVEICKRIGFYDYEHLTGMNLLDFLLANNVCVQVYTSYVAGKFLMYHPTRQ